MTPWTAIFLAGLVVVLPNATRAVAITNLNCDETSVTCQDADPLLSVSPTPPGETRILRSKPLLPFDPTFNLQHAPFILAPDINFGPNFEINLPHLKRAE